MYGRAFIYSAWKESELYTGDQIGRRIWKVVILVLIVWWYVFATLGWYCDDGKPCWEITHSLLLFNALTQNEKLFDFSQKTYRSRIRSSGTKKPQVVTFLFLPLLKILHWEMPKESYSVGWMGGVSALAMLACPYHCRLFFVLFRRTALYRRKYPYFDSHLASKHSEWCLFFYLMLQCELFWMQWCVSFQIAIFFCVFCWCGNGRTALHCRRPKLSPDSLDFTCVTLCPSSEYGGPEGTSHSGNTQILP